MDGMDLLRHNLDITYGTEDWFVPLRTALEGVTAEQANWRPAGRGANTIAEITAHLLFYKERLLQRLQGETVTISAANNDATFVPDSSTEESWQAMVMRMDAVHSGLAQAAAGLPPEAFDRPLPKHELGMQLNSILLHEAHHGGQIVYIRKLQGSWPGKRSFD
jgi:uncharacterized damage-inducible protein DinB